MEEGVAASPSPGNQGSPGGASADQDDGGEGTVGYLQSASPHEEDLFLPIANISRIMKCVLPANAKIAKEAKELLQECVTEFIGFITSEANDKCLREKRKTINGDDLIWAMKTLGFENYVEPLTVYLHRYRELEGDIRVMVGSCGGLELPIKKEESGSTNLPNAQHR